MTAEKRIRVVIYGAWYLGEVVAETIAELGWEVAGFVDPAPPPGRETLSALPDDVAVHVAIGDNPLRAQVTRNLLEHSRPLVSIIHPSARVSPTAEIGRGVYAAENTVVRTGAAVGTGSLLQSGAVVSHHCTIGDYVSMGPNAAAASHVRIGDCADIGVGACIKPWIEIGDHSVAGAGAVVMTNVPQDSMAVGNPARAYQNVKAAKPKQSDWPNHHLW